LGVVAFFILPPLVDSVGYENSNCCLICTNVEAASNLSAIFIFLKDYCDALRLFHFSLKVKAARNRTIFISDDVMLPPPGAIFVSSRRNLNFHVLPPIDLVIRFRVIAQDVSLCRQTMGMVYASFRSHEDKNSNTPSTG
jgi:hypothetical protein